MNELLYTKSPDYIFLPPAFYDAMGQLLVSAPDIEMEPALREAFNLAGLEFTKEKMEKAATRLLQEKETDAKKGPPSPPKKERPTLGSSMLNWLNGLPSKAVCYYLAGFDPAKVTHFYFECDMLAVIEAFKLKSEYEMQSSKINYEASLYGFGGSYEGDKGSSGKVTEVDISEGASPDAIRSLKALKF